MPHWICVGFTIGQYVRAVMNALYCNYSGPAPATTGTFCIGLIGTSSKLSHPCSAPSHCRSNQHRSRRPESLSKWASQIVGGRYSAMLPPPNMSNLPPAAQAAINACRTQFLSTDRGHVRRANDKSVDSRSRFFAEWLESAGHTKQSAAMLTQNQIIDTIGAFLDDIKKGNNLQGLHLTGQSLRNYIISAALCFKLLTGVTTQYYDPATMTHKRIYLHPYLHDKIVQRTTWSNPTKQKEPFTYRMLEVHAKQYLKTIRKDSNSQFYSLNHVVWDWLRLGVFTGSRVAEYAQSGLKRNQRFQCIPKTKDAGQWAGQPLAFIREDFQFYDKTQCGVPHIHAYESYRKGRLQTLHIQF